MHPLKHAGLCLALISPSAALAQTGPHVSPTPFGVAVGDTINRYRAEPYHVTENGGIWAEFDPFFLQIDPDFDEFVSDGILGFASAQGEVCEVYGLTSPMQKAEAERFLKQNLPTLEARFGPSELKSAGALDGVHPIWGADQVTIGETVKRFYTQNGRAVFDAIEFGASQAFLPQSAGPTARQVILRFTSTNHADCLKQ